MTSQHKAPFCSHLCNSPQPIGGHEEFGLPNIDKWVDAVLPEHLQGNLLVHAVMFFIPFIIFDVLIARHMPGTTARYFTIHAVANTIVAVYALPDLWLCLKDPLWALSTNYSYIPLHFVTNCHLYHLVAFRGVSLEDWIHHLLFVGVICPLGYYNTSGPLQNLVAFFLSGFPGGVNYYMVVAQKLNLCTSATVKTWNTRINVWIRAPGCLYAAFVGYAAFRYAGEWSNLQSPIVIGVVVVLCFVNGLYYMQVVVGNTFRKVDTFSS